MYKRQGLARVVEDALGRGGLAGIDVGHDADVAGILERSFLRCHCVYLLPAIVREGAIGFGHLVDVFALLDGRAQTIGCIHDLVGEALGHAALLAVARIADDPTDGERGGAAGVDLGGHLVRGTADATGLDLDGRADVCLLYTSRCV